MTRFSFLDKEKISQLPLTAGVYCFKSPRELLYIGKANNIRERVKNHFSQPSFKDSVFIPETQKIGFLATNSEIAALILEAELIKKYQPKYNTQWKDSKNYFYVVITKEDFPRVFVTHQPPGGKNFQFSIFNFQTKPQTKNSKPPTTNYQLLTAIGPFVDGKALKQTLRVLRRVFPFRTCQKMPKKPCLYKELSLCPAPCQEQNYELRIMNYEREYGKNIKSLIKILRGQKTQVSKNLRQEMRQASKKQDFERAKILRDQSLALENVFSHSHILRETSLTEVAQQLPESRKLLGNFQKLLGLKEKINRIEGYDVSNIQGQEATGSMVVFSNGQPNKNEYRKFKIKITGKPNDTAMLKETLERRLKHKEWPMPQVVLIDGGKAQLGVALQLKVQSAKCKVISLAKRKNELFLEGQEKPVLLKDLSPELANLILRIRDEAHRFAIAYHKKLRSKKFISR